ncbi:hypothetical protein BIW11_13684 [Tropilaelaps mercedesae]|uniref:Uncharacterized protein n=1 Tax=Tropilaelaps mercedesae TaxID=418985 RepID=A0A1V9X0Q9_9ACAR|nr:hypothetical protein BIW11_13684 [Tropilaelaps mercedesae]
MWIRTSLFRSTKENAQLKAIGLLPSQRKKTAGWDVFQDPPPPEDDDTINPQWIDVSLKITKVIVYIITASIVLSSSIIAKGTLLFITSHVGQKSVAVCRQGLPVERDKDYEAAIPAVERVAWVWALFLVLIMPELFTLFRAGRVCFFKSYRPPSKSTFIMNRQTPKKSAWFRASIHVEGHAPAFATGTPFKSCFVPASS